MAGERILIVEDEGILAMSLKMTLSEFGYRVVGVSPSGEEGVRLAASLSPDVVIMDIKLAGPLDGIEAAHRITNASGTPIIFLTAHTDDDTYRKAMKVRPAGFLQKPIEEYRWSHLIEDALRKP